MAIGTTLPITERPIHYRGIVNLTGFFLVMKNWLEDNQFEFHEHIVKSKLASDGLRREYTWYAWRNVNEYIKFEITIFMDIRNIEEVEVIRKGKKEKLSQCRIRLEPSGQVVLDPHKRFEGRFLEKLRAFMHEYLIKKEILYIWGDQLDYQLMKMEKVVKEYLEFEAKTMAYEYKWR